MVSVYHTQQLSVPGKSFVHWQMDLIELNGALVHENLGYQYVLTVIDILHKTKIKELQLFTNSKVPVIFFGGVYPILSLQH